MLKTTPTQNHHPTILHYTYILILKHHAPMLVWDHLPMKLWNLLTYAYKIQIRHTLVQYTVLIQLLARSIEEFINLVLVVTHTIYYIYFIYDTYQVLLKHFKCSLLTILLTILSGKASGFRQKTLWRWWIVHTLKGRCTKITMHTQNMYYMRSQNKIQVEA